MVLRSYEWHQYYLALALFCSAITLVLLLENRTLVLPFSVCTMLLFSGSAVVNAVVIRQKRHGASVFRFKNVPGSESNENNRW